MDTPATPGYWDAADVHRHWCETLDLLSVELGEPRWRIEEAFAYGACAALAVAVAEHRGLPLGIVTADDSYAHAFVVIGDGIALDIWGVRTFDQILSVWREDDPDCGIRLLPVEELSALDANPVPEIFSTVPARMAKDGCLAGAVLDDFAIVEFNCGACGDLAVVLHDLTGWALKAEFDWMGDIEHIWVEDEDGRAIDINGVHEGGRAVTPYSNAKPGPIKPITRSDAEGSGKHGHEQRRWASALVVRYPKRFGLESASSPRLQAALAP